MTPAPVVPPLALYLHLPWCVRKCPYCDFNSHALVDAAAPEQYVEVLLEDLRTELEDCAGRTVESVFLGGGTPSLFSGAQIARLLAGVRSLTPLAAQAEVTMEANPGVVERDRFEAYRKAGVTRISLGAQSFDDAVLRRIGRIHGAEEIDRAVGDLRQAGFENFNLDLMYGLPGQTLAGARTDLERALGHDPAHISYYQLTLEPNTLFAACPPRLPEDELCWDMQKQGEALLPAAGLRRYEVSAFARRGRECRHNLNYWRFGDYLGIGAGAHGKLTLGTGVRRRTRARQPKRYLAGPRLAGEHYLTASDLVFEYFLNALRLVDGFRREEFEARTGLSWDTVEVRVATAQRDGLLEFAEGRWRPSPLGWRFHNDLQARFLPAEA